MDKSKFPDAAFVELKLYLPELKKTVSLTRRVKSPKAPTIRPSDDDVRAVLSEVADHPEITLTRRDILRFILTEPTKRSQEIQSLLKLDQVGDVRKALNTAQNRLKREEKAALVRVGTTRDSLRLHLQISEFSGTAVVAAANESRGVLGLPTITKLLPETKLDAGLTASKKGPQFNKESALRDLKALSDAVEGLKELGRAETAAIARDLEALESDPALLASLKSRPLIESGMDLIDGPECPLCDTPWDEKELREHLQAKLIKSERASALQDSLVASGAALANESAKLAALIQPIGLMAKTEKDKALGQRLDSWRSDLASTQQDLATIEGLRELKDRLQEDWTRPPKNVASDLAKLSALIDAKPDQSATLAAQTLLTTAQARLADYREARRGAEAARVSAAAASAAYKCYCESLEVELEALYDEVQGDFSDFYRELNEDDEGSFNAKFTPTEGSLTLDVNFYERGLFPPGAYHSEGHQDGMGVCLYLALMKRLFGTRFSFALLDDVVMSVDSGHRYQFCKLLKTHFAETQFVVTTHDRLWAEQMKSAGLVTAKTSRTFHSWTIDSGPLVESGKDIWGLIDEALAKGRVEAAAAALRHHLEYASRHLADELGASPQFRSDGDYQLGELLPSVLVRAKRVHQKAAKAAKSWADTAAEELVANRIAALAGAAKDSNVEQWAVNKAVHYNVWANFGKKDFEPVVASFKTLLDTLRCGACDSWLYVTPKRGPAETLRCACNAVSLNLKSK